MCLISKPFVLFIYFGHEFFVVDNEALVRALADGALAVCCADLEGELAAVDGDELGGGGDGVIHCRSAVVRMLRLMPTVPAPSSICALTAAQAASSIRAHIAGVAKTASEPLFMVAAMLAAVTVVVAVPIRLVANVDMYIPSFVIAIVGDFPSIS